MVDYNEVYKLEKSEKKIYKKRAEVRKTDSVEKDKQTELSDASLKVEADQDLSEKEQGKAQLIRVQIKIYLRKKRKSQLIRVQIKRHLRKNRKSQLIRVQIKRHLRKKRKSQLIIVQIKRHLRKKRKSNKN